MYTETQQIKDLTELNEALENYFRNTIIPQLFIDADLILQKFTPAASKQFKLSDDDIGISINDMLDKFRFENITDDIQLVIDSNIIIEKEVQTTDLRWYQMNILPYVTLEDNKTNGVIVTFVEITKRIKDLKEQEKLVTEFELLLDTLSHDVKSPIANLSMAIDLIKTLPRENTKDFTVLLHAMQSSISKVLTLVSELIDTRKQEHKYVAKKEVLDFKMILEDVRLLLYNDIKESDAVINYKLTAPEIFFSRRKIRSILYNLLINSIKYKSPGIAPRILIKTYLENDFVVITVKDNGIGIDSKNKEEIFSKYFRVENEIEGSGIGLFLVKELITNAGGKIEVHSELGKGSEFKLYLKAR